MNEWISIKEKKPPNLVRILIAIRDNRSKIINRYFILIAKRVNDAWIDDHQGHLIDQKLQHVTHWMPLPDEPNEQN